MDPDNGAALLARTQLFRDVDPKVLARVSQLLVVRKFRKGAQLFQQDQPGNALILLVQGAVSVYVLSPEGERMVLSTMRPPDVLGEIALLDGGSRSASGEAVEPTTVLALPREAFLQLMRTEPKLAEQMFVSLGRLVRKLSEQAADFIFLDLPSRVAKSLCRLADGQRALPAQFTSATGPVIIPITQGRLAEIAGGSRQSVNQILGQLADEQIVEVRDRTVRIVDLERLRRRARLPESI